MNQLQISLFDPLQIRLNNKVVADFRTQKVLALLVYLAADPETAHRRETIMTLLWPGMPDNSARANLRQILFHLRKAIPDLVVDNSATSTELSESVPLLITNRHTIQLNPVAPVTIDTTQFDAHLQQVQTHDHYNFLSYHQCHEELTTATALYTGAFLADFYLEDSNEFEEWAEIKRQTYLRKMLDALDTLTKINIQQHAYATAQQYAERQLELDNLHEPAYQQLMEILARNGQRNTALAVYEKCRRLFNEELGMAPAARTTELYEQILAGDLQLNALQEQGVRGYDLQEEIGAGAYGVIHRALQPVVGREVAVKIIHRQYANDPAFIRRFETEAQTIARLEHPHIVPLYDFWRDPDGAYLVMRLLRGGNLLTALSKGYWSLERTRALLDQICAALAAAHQQGIVHRDIKPANILFDESNNAYLSDFGIAKDLHSNQGLTTDGSMLGTPDYISPEQIQEAPVSPQSDIYSLGAVLYEMLTGEKPFPDVPLMTLYQNHLTVPIPLVSDTRPDLPPQIDAVIQKATAKKPEERFTDALTFAKAFGQAVDGRLDMPAVIAQMPTAVEVINPYKGLRAFQEADAQDFYGRDSLTSQLIEHLHASSFLAVVGPSGSGKSSVVKAGMIPALRQGAIPGSEKWFVAEMVPGTHPLEELELALWPIAVDPPPSLVKPMQRDPRGMLRTIRRILPKEEDAQLLLVIDQFEELWSLTNAARRQHFLDSLLVAIRSSRCPLHVVITLRADFYDRPLQYQPIAELFKQNTEVVLPLTHDELTWAIQEPARWVGVEFEETVLPAIVAEVHDQPGILPLLQYALTELFDARTDRQISRTSYDEIGGVLGALPQRADEIYDSLSSADKGAARHFFLRLVTVGDEVTRRRVLLSEVTALNLKAQLNITPDSPIFEIANRFGEARLLTFDHDPLTRRPTVEVAHEALLREWTRLRTWLDESRDDLRLQRLLATAVAEWQTADKDPGYLLLGTRLDQFELWAEDTTVALTADEQAYLTASLAARQQRQAEEAARQQRELATAQQLAETERQRAEEQLAAAQNLRRRAAYLGVALVVAAFLAIAAVVASVQANNNAETAVTNANIAATAQVEALAQAEEAQKNADLAATAEAQAEIERVLAQENEATAVAAQEDALAQAELARFNEGQAQSLALTSGAKEAYAGGNVDLALALAMQATAIEQPPTEAVRTLVDVAYAPGTQQIFEYDSFGWMEILKSLYPDDTKPLIIMNQDGAVQVWDKINGAMINEFSVANQEARIVTPRHIPDSNLIVVGYQNSDVIVWDWSTGEKVQSLQGADLTNWGSNFGGADGDTVLTIGRYGGPETEVDGVPAGFNLVAWDINSGEQRYRLDGARGERETETAITPDYKTLLIASSLANEQADNIQNARLRFVDVVTGEIINEPELAELPDNNIINSITISPAGDQAFLIIRDPENYEFGKTGLIISLPDGEVTTTVPFDSEIVTANYSPDGALIAVERDSPSNNYFTLLDATTGEQLHDLGSVNEGHNKIVNQRGFEFTPDGQRLVGADQAGAVLIWDVETGALIQRLFGHNGESIFTATVSPDGQSAVSTGGGVMRVWDIAEDATARVFDAHQSGIIGDVTISPDGSKAISTAIFSDDDSDNEAILWDTSTFEIIQRLPGFFASAEFLPDGRSAILGADVGGVDDHQGLLGLVHWDIESGDIIKRAENREVAVAFDIALSPDEKSFLVGTLSNNMLHYDLETFTELNRFSTNNEPEWFVSTAFSPDGNIAIAGGDLGDIILFDLETGAELRRINQGSVTTDLAMSADGQHLISAGSDRSLVLWDFATGEALQTYNGHTDEVTSVTYTPDESQLVSASANGDLILWDVASGEPLRTFSEHDAYVNTVTLSPDGQLAYSAADDGTVIVRPIATVPIDEIMTHISENRVLHEFTCVERKQYRIFPLCDADGVVPDSDG